MKPSLPALVLLSALLAGAAAAAGLPGAAAVHTQPDPASPALTYLKAGTEPQPAPGVTAPPGWIAVEVPGPFEVYVENKDLTKSLDVRPGAALRQAPKADAGIVLTAGPAEKVTITGIRGRWTQLSLERSLTGYVPSGSGAASPTAVPPPAPAPAPAAPLSQAPVAPGVYGVAPSGQAVTLVNTGDGGSSSLPRSYAGRVVSTRRPLAPRRPYDYALNDDSGRRFAYLDLSKLPPTEDITRYLDRAVVAYGVARPSLDSHDFILAVETLQLR